MTDNASNPPLVHQDQTNLMDAPGGCRVRVRGVKSGRGLRSRLSALGITPGSEVYVCPGCTCKGSRRITVREASFVLDEEMAKAIECRCMEEAAGDPHKLQECLYNGYDTLTK